MSKYGNKKITLDGIQFDSMLEGAFYQKLKAYKEAGKIHDFKLQVPYVLHGANGIAICKYKLDFEIEIEPSEPPTEKYFRKVRTGVMTIQKNKRCVEVKGYFTAVAKLKKLFEAEYQELEMHYKDKPWVL